MACLESVAAQRHTPHEVIVVDDGSTDGTVAALSNRVGITVIQQANAGPGAARNRGVSVATGDYIAFLDSDDLWFPWSLAAIAKLIADHGQPSLIFVRFRNFAGNTQLGEAEQPAVGHAYSDYLAAASDGLFAGAGMMVVSRTEFLKVGGFVEDRLNAEDHDLALRLGTSPGFVQVSAPLIVAHRQHAGSEMADIRKSLLGVARLVDAERSGLYGGGANRQAARRAIITCHCRPTVLKGLKVGERSRALSVYFKTVPWHLRMVRLRFLMCVPVLAILSFLPFGGPATGDRA